jgi:hypothetical protein
MVADDTAAFASDDKGTIPSEASNKINASNLFIFSPLFKKIARAQPRSKRPSAGPPFS